MPGAVPRGSPGAREKDQAACFDFDRQTAGGLDHLGKVIVGIGLRSIPGATAALGAAGDAVHDVDTLQRILTDRGLAREHDRVSLFENGIGHVRHLGARR